MAKIINIRDCEKSWKDAINMTKKYKNEIMKVQKTSTSDKKKALQNFDKKLDDVNAIFKNDIILINCIKNDPENDNHMINRLISAIKKREKLVNTISSEYHKIFK